MIKDAIQKQRVEKLSQILSPEQMEALWTSPAFTCHRCGHKWARHDYDVKLERYTRIPKKCPECDSPGWAYPVQNVAHSKRVKAYHRNIRLKLKELERLQEIVANTA